MAYATSASSEVAEGAGVEPASRVSETRVQTVIPTLNGAARSFKPTGRKGRLNSIGCS